METIIVAILGVFMSLLTLGAVLAIPYFFIRVILKQIEYGKLLKTWGLDLKKRHTTQAEFATLLQDMKQVKWGLNSPEYWGYCRHIFYATLNSHDVTLEQKRQLYEEMDRMKVHGLPYPQDRKNQHRPDDVKYDVF